MTILQEWLWFVNNKCFKCKVVDDELFSVAIFQKHL